MTVVLDDMDNTNVVVLISDPDDSETDSETDQEPFSKKQRYVDDT